MEFEAIIFRNFIIYAYKATHKISKKSDMLISEMF